MKWPTYLPEKGERQEFVNVGGIDLEVTFVTEAGDEPKDPPHVDPVLIRFDMQDKRWFLISEVFKPEFAKHIRAAIYRDVYGIETE
jgi:hypothetical protein